jgi:hypothetical protein
MTGKNSRWVPLALIGLIAIGAAAIAAVVFNVTGPGAAPTPLPRFITLDQINVPDPQITRTSLEETRAALESGQAIVVDVRSQDFYQRSHIAGAVSMPYGELAQRLIELDKRQWIITYCA